ncbi:hypothetical protein [Lentzea albida]|uniref:hypothetical protein n=1 Tax=Lentzea albida TaxID=65499 RepID=UPI0011601128|nr:hypothetical protein [Lentzea albida]
MNNQAPASLNDAPKRLEFDYGSWVPTLITVVPVVIATLKILSLAHWDYTLVPVVLRALDIGAVALAVLLTSSPLFCASVLYFLPRLVRLGQVHMLVGAAIGLAISLWTLFAVPVAYAAFLAPTSIFVTGTLWRHVPGIAERRQADAGPTTAIGYVSSILGKSLISVAVIYTVFAVYIYPNGAGSWLPVEVIEKTDKSKIVAYVLEAGDHDLTAMPLSSDDPMIIRQDDVARRTLCRLARPSWRKQALTMPLLRFSERPMRGTVMPTCDDLVPSRDPGRVTGPDAE